MKDVLVPLVLLPLLAGCSVKRDFTAMRHQIDSLQSGQRELRERLAAADSVNRAQAGLLDELRSSLWDLSQRAAPAAGEPERPRPPAGADRPRVDLLPIGQAQPERPPDDGKREYDAAYLEVTRRNYGAAASGFRSFLSRHPRSGLADNAQYWIGECLYAQGRYREAGTEFEKVVSAHPDQDKVPAALLKAGLCHQRLKDNARAEAAWKKLLQQHPNSPEAKLARERMKSK